MDKLRYSALLTLRSNVKICLLLTSFKSPLEEKSEKVDSLAWLFIMHGKCIALFSLILHGNEIQQYMLFSFLEASQSLCCYVLYAEPLTDRQIQKHSVFPSSSVHV